MSKHPWTLAAAMALAAGTLRAGDPAPGDAQDLCFLAGGHPTFVRLRIEINEKPLGVAWREAVGALHAFLDFNNDGTVRREEAEQVDWNGLIHLFDNPGQASRAAAGRGRGPAGPALPALDARPQDGVVSAEELAEFLRALRGPISVQAVSQSDAEKDRTFARIDTSGDGTLSPGERAEAAVRLRSVDQNDDEVISADELAAFRNPFFRFAAPSPQGGGAAPVVLLDPGVSRIRMVQQLLNRLDIGGPDGGKAGDHRLSRAEAGLEAEAFAAFDNDGDGTLDSDELMQFLDRGEPAVEIILRLGRLLKRSAIELIDRKPLTPRVRMRASHDGAVILDLDDVCLELRADESIGRAGDAWTYYTARFQDLDADKNGSLSISESRGEELLRSLFRLMDRNNDAQVSKDEMSAVRALLNDLERGLAVLEVTDRGVLLFSNLDVDSDGRLGLRELQAASERLASFDRNGDGQVTAAEIPQRFDWSLSPAQIPHGYALRADRRDQMPPPRRHAAPAPAWFRNMDRNHDGDLSPREFLGPRAAFQRLDANGDGLIDAGEAK
jgi:Ca2+-binding EF-hand superfamily protein